MTKYFIKKIFYSLQGEGHFSGRPAIFVRFTGCNLWTGKEADRKNAICKFCDTDFVGIDGESGGKYTALELTSEITKIWENNINPRNKNIKPFIICTGGEPLLQLDQYLVDTFHENNFEIAIETNGTIIPPEKIDWICVSPKANATLKLKKGNEIKIVYPQKGINPIDFENMAFEHFFIQPLVDKNIKSNTKKAVNFCLKNPKWSLSLQIHKILGIK